jgi:hypothetical protein
MLLCDYAEEFGGKLYIMGGGWSRLFTPNQPTNIALAIKISIPWDEGDRPHDFVVRLRRDQKPETLKTDEGQDIQVAGRIEAMRPTELRSGSYLDVPLATKLQGLSLEPGSYVWEVLVDGDVLEGTPFEVVAVQ